MRGGRQALWMPSLHKHSPRASRTTGSGLGASSAEGIHTVSALRSSHPGRCECDQTGKDDLDCISGPEGCGELWGPGGEGIGSLRYRASKLKLGDMNGFPDSDTSEGRRGR